MLTDCQNSCTVRFMGKFAIKSLLNIPQYHKCVATSHCKLVRSENSDNLKHTLWLMINHKVV